MTSDHEQQLIVASQIEHELRKTNEQWAKALAERDRSALDQIMSDDFVLAYPFEGDDKEQFIADVTTGELRVDSLEQHDATLRVSGDSAIIFGSETATWQYRGRDLSGSYRFLRVYTRQQGRWQIMALHLCLPSHRS